MAKEREAAKDVALKIRPLDDRVVVEPLEAEDKTAGGILLPDTAKQKPQRGRVIAVGPGKLLDNGQRATLNVAKGDEVIFGRYAGNDIEVNRTEYKIMRETDILAKVVK
jgi:chaperonin GroES